MSTDAKPPANQNVIHFPAPFRGDLPVKYIMENALLREADLSECIVIGRFKDTGQLYLTTTSDNPMVVNWLLDRTKLALLDGETGFIESPK